MNDEPTTEEPTGSAIFADAESREWEPRLDYVKARKIREVAKVDLDNVAQIGRAWAELISDDLKMLDTVWLSIADESGEEAGGVTKDEWLAAMDGDLLDDARRALMSAVESFTGPLKRKILRESIDAIENGYRKAIKRAEENLAAEVPAAIERALNEADLLHRRKSAAPATVSTNARRPAKRKRS